MNHRWDVIVIGGGAAGIFAAIRAAERGLSTLLIEKNRKLGVKILISGGTRCNITHDTSAKGILSVFDDQASFLRHAIGSFGPNRVIELIESTGVPTKVETTGKVFPKSDRASDVMKALIQRLKSTACQLKLHSAVEAIEQNENRFDVYLPNTRLTANNVIVTTGGRSYPECGTTGDGYAWATSLGHTVSETHPALVPITSNEKWIPSLQGVTIDDAHVKVCRLHDDSAPHIDDERRGAILFTHFGISGPAALDVSRVISRGRLSTGPPPRFELHCNLAPHRTESDYERFIKDAMVESGGRQVVNLVANMIPKRLAEVICGSLGLPCDLKISELSRRFRQQLVQSLICWKIPVCGTRGFKKAEVTAGGIVLDEINPKTMESLICPNLYFAGEILNIDGPIGGYNFQAAFSTGWLAGGCVRSSPAT